MRFSIALIPALFLVACSGNGNNNDSENNEPLSFEMQQLCINETKFLGSFDEIDLYEGGFSGLIYIPGSDLEFFTVTDRGPNALIEEIMGKESHILFPLPDYTQKVIRLKLENNEFKMVSIHPILDMDGNPIGGLPPHSLVTEHPELAFDKLNGSQPVQRKWNFDIEAISIDANGDIWLADEYRPAIVLVDGKSYRIKEVFSAEANDLGGTRILDSYFSKRMPNRGFEGIAVTPSGKILAMLQSPIQNFESLDTIPTRLIRILYFDPFTGKSKVFGYETSEHVRDPKIGDIAVINENEFLIIEHGKDSSGKTANIFRLDIEFSSDISKHEFGLGTSFEALINNAKAQYQGFILAQKSHVLNLIDAGFDPSFGKPEGLTVINDNTIAVINDNDFGIDKLDENGKLKMNQQANCIYLFTFNKPVFR
jgi:hypothetical protein